ncbi:MAG TPA: hypothetical protein VFW35_04285 [Sphingomicrobium sp.]|nr:hypothetical protein [Sphingomicrobium sp.]
MHTRITDLLKPRTWRAARAFLKAVSAYHKGDYEAALVHFDQSMSLDVLRTDEHMAFRTVLLVLTHRPPQERMDIYKRIIAGEFRPGRKASEYARAYANYFLGYSIGRQDVVTLWSQAYALKPIEGFAARYLPLPKSPILSSPA